MKYVFFDIDGTIRGKSREITKRNKEAIRKLRENGHQEKKASFVCYVLVEVKQKFIHIF